MRTDRPSSQVTKPDGHSHGSSNNCYVSLYKFLWSQQLLVSSSIVHIPKSTDTETRILNLTHPLPTSASSVHLYAWFKTHLQQGTDKQLEQQTAGFNSQLHDYSLKDPKPWLTPYLISLFIHGATQYLRPSAKANCPALSLKYVDATQWDTGDWKASLRPSYHLFLYHDQHEIVLAARFPLNRSSTETKNRKKTKCTQVDVSPAARSVRCVGGPPPSGHGLQCIFVEGCSWKTQADGKGRTSPREAHTHCHTHFF